MKVVVFAPHPDDDVIGCGGSIVKHVKQGDQVTVVYLTNGDAGDLRYSKEAMAEIRKKEAHEAAAVLGVKDLVFLGLADGYVEYNPETLASLITHIRRYQPDMVYLPHREEAHRDHANTFLLASEAITRAWANSYQESEGAPWRVSTVLGYEVWTPLQQVSYSVDISAFMDDKLRALGMHTSQLENVQYDKAVEGLNRYRGALTGTGTYAECFSVLKASRL